VRPLPSVTGTVAVLDRPDVDTDQIIPKQFLKRIERAGFGEFLFHDWMKDPAFELHAVPDASILVAGRNFGCGSSREHAAWALEDYGFRAVVAPSFGDIFRQNAISSGLAPIVLDADVLERVKEAVALRNELTVDLESLRIRHPTGLEVAFELDPHVQETLVLGLDAIGRTLQREAEIAAFEATYAPRFDLAAI
jgi:3-isopropylmalate/(R)-2-methylmalate dehydratase small subunit